jgi:ferritin
MKTNRLSENSTALNEQMTKEAHASQSTYRMPRADNNGFAGIANFLFAMQQRSVTT